jgi:hypothetical protein
MMFVPRKYEQFTYLTLKYNSYKIFPLLHLCDFQGQNKLVEVLEFSSHFFPFTGRRKAQSCENVVVNYSNTQCRIEWNKILMK